MSKGFQLTSEFGANSCVGSHEGIVLNLMRIQQRRTWTLESVSACELTSFRPVLGDICSSVLALAQTVLHIGRMIVGKWPRRIISQINVSNTFARICSRMSNETMYLAFTLNGYQSIQVCE